MSRHCTSGRPASIITENWRVKTARFLAGTPRALSFLTAAAGAGLGLRRLDLRHLDLLAAQRRDHGIHGVAHALARNVLARYGCVLKKQTLP